MRKLFTLFTLLLLCLLPVTALAQDDNHDNHEGWTPLTKITNNTLPEGKYYLPDNLTCTGEEETRISITGEVTLCLNGHVLNLNGQSLEVQKGATFHLCDCNPTNQPHKFTVGSDGLWTLNEENGTETLTGGVITGGKSPTNSYGGGVLVLGSFEMSGGNLVGNTAKYGGGVYVQQSGTFTMSDGNISGNIANGSGGGVYVESGSFTMSGGSISENTSIWGGGVYVESGSFTMSGGNISGNIADDSGGGVYVYMGSTFTMSGGSISENTSIWGGGVYVRSGTFTMSGAPKVTNNTDNNVYLYNGPITIGEGGLTEGANIGVTLWNASSVVNNWDSQWGNPAEYFTSDNSDYGVGLDDQGHVVLKEVYRVILYPNDGTIAEDKDITSYTSGTSVTLPTANDVTREGYTFAGWYENEDLTGNEVKEITANDKGDKQYWAKWTINSYTITAQVAAGCEGMGEVTGSGTYKYGAPVNLTATPSNGYYFVEWKVVSGTVTIQNNQFTMPAENVEVQAVFGCSVTNITLDKTELSLYTGNTATLTATVEPSDATNKNVTWGSDKSDVATVDANGKVTAVGAGETTITATTQDGGKTATCKVQVREEVKVKASGSTNLSFTTDRDKFTLTATVYAQGNVLNPTDGSWRWTVADEDVVALSGSPTLLRAFASSSRQAFKVEGTGTTTITATYDDGTYRGSVDFTVHISKPTPPDPISYYNIYVEDVCDGVEVTTSKNTVREGGSISLYVEKDTANYTFDNFKVYYKRSYYGPWEVLEEGTQPGEYPINNIWTHIYIKAEGAIEKEDPTGIEQVEGVKVYTKDGSLYVQTPQREQVLVITMTGVVVKNEEQVGLKQYHGLQPGIYVVRIGERAYKVRLN